ncbi:MAG: hypothetical protein K2K54_06845 [Lachnospiraceae bacterium]|nr:hypothetical protein [Lachnospiraceae bacterium]
MVDKIFDTYHADYFYVMGYEIGIVDGDLAQVLRELPDRDISFETLEKADSTGNCTKGSCGKSCL